MMNFRLHFCVLLDVNLEIVSLVRAYTQWRNTTEQPVLWEDVPSMLGTLTCHEHVPRLSWMLFRYKIFHIWCLCM